MKEENWIEGNSSTLLFAFFLLISVYLINKLGTINKLNGELQIENKILILKLDSCNLTIKQ